MSQSYKSTSKLFEDLSHNILRFAPNFLHPNPWGYANQNPHKKVVIGTSLGYCPGSCFYEDVFQLLILTDFCPNAWDAKGFCLWFPSFPFEIFYFLQIAFWSYKTLICCHRHSKLRQFLLFQLQFVIG